MKILFITGFVGLLILISCNFADASNIGLIRNEMWSYNLTAVYYSALAFGDIDNDSDMDLILYGQANSGDVAKVYINNGTLLLESPSWQQYLQPMRDGGISFGDIDNDGDLDLITSGCISGGGQSSCTSVAAKAYINDGSSFAENTTWLGGVEAVSESSLRFGDIDNDGDLDLGLIGYSIGGPVGRVYTNNGSSLVEDQTWEQNLEDVYQGSLDFGDIDNDGDLDLVITGDTSVEGKITKIYINNGTSFVEDLVWSSDLLGVDRSCVAFGDIDNDGDLDLALIGQFSADHLRFYVNNGTSLVENQTQEMGGLEGYFRGSIGWGDYDNDGDLDIFGIGKEYDRNWIYRNENNFSIDYSASNDLHTDNMQQGASAWIDIDGDGTLDLFASGVNTTDLVISVYINNNTLSNNIPSCPASLNEEFVDGLITLSWNSGSDTETQPLGLYYNLRVGTCPGCHDVVSGSFGGSSGGGGGGGPANAYFGNMMQRKSITLNRQFEPGTKIYWAVQTIDTGLAKSAWSTEQVYVIPENGSGNETNCTPSWSCCSWGACQPDDTQACGTWVDANGCNETYTGPNTQSCTYDEPGSPNGESRPSGGTITQPDVDYTFDAIEPGIVAEKEVSEGIIISVRVKNAVSKVTLAVRSFREKLEAVKEAVKGKLYGYLEVNSTGLSDDDIEEVYIEFRVNKTWIDENGIDPETVRLSRYESGNWTKLDTEMVEEAPSVTGSLLRLAGMITGLAIGVDNYYTYRARTPGFSYFAITGDTFRGDEDNETAEPSLLCTPGEMRCSGRELQQCGTMGTVWITKELCEGECDTEKGCTEITPMEVPWWYIIISGIALVAGYIIWRYLKGRRKYATMEEALEHIHTV
jgi:PGF-pre-PGF domain-containing protein